MLPAGHVSVGVVKLGRYEVDHPHRHAGQPSQVLPGARPWRHGQGCVLFLNTAQVTLRPARESWLGIGGLICNM